MEDQAQAAPEADTAGTPSPQSPPAAPAEEIRVGFEAALDKHNANWRNEWSQQNIEAARYFYRQGLQDTSVFVNASVRTLQEGYAWLGKNAAETAPVPQAPVEPPQAPAAETPVAEAAVAAATVVDTEVTLSNKFETAAAGEEAPVPTLTEVVAEPAAEVECQADEAQPVEACDPPAPSAE